MDAMGSSKHLLRFGVFWGVQMPLHKVFGSRLVILNYVKLTWPATVYPPVLTPLYSLYIYIYLYIFIYIYTPKTDVFVDTPNPTSQLGCFFWYR